MVRGLATALANYRRSSEIRTAHEVHCDNPTLMLLLLEIGRVEHEWTEEAKGHRRQLRNRLR